MRNKNIISIIFAILISILLSCSPKISRKVLSFFFDGVPPYQKETVTANDTLNKTDSIRTASLSFPTESPKIFYHSPYAKEPCVKCHNQSAVGNFIPEQPSVCYQCHEDFNKKYSFLHGPVASGFCTQCHHQHQSKNEKLLLRTGQNICLHCHNAEQVFKNEKHKEIEKENCTKCHNQHGGKDKYFLN